MPKTVTLRLPDDVYRTFSNCAKAVKRSLANFIEVAALEHAHRSSFVEDEEMAQILSDARLRQHLREGSREARAMQGKYVG